MLQLISEVILDLRIHRSFYLILLVFNDYIITSSMNMQAGKASHMNMKGNAMC